MEENILDTTRTHAETLLFVLLGWSDKSFQLEMVSISGGGGVKKLACFNIRQGTQSLRVKVTKKKKKKGSH